MQLICELLRGLYQNPKIDESNCDEILREICDVRLKADKSVFNPLAAEKTLFIHLPARLRVWILYKLCCWRLDDEQSVTDAIDIKDTVINPREHASSRTTQLGYI